MSNTVATGAEDNGPCCDKCGQHKKVKMLNGWVLCVDCYFQLTMFQHQGPVVSVPPSIQPYWTVHYPPPFTYTVTKSGEAAE